MSKKPWKRKHCKANTSKEKKSKDISLPPAQATRSNDRKLRSAK